MKEKRKCQSQNRITSKPILTTHTKLLMNGVMKNKKKVQRKRCIGKFDPDTGKVIPNGKVGRPSLSRLPRTSAKSDTPRNELLDISPDDIKKLTARLNKIEEALQALSVEIHDLRVEVESLPARNTQES